MRRPWRRRPGLSLGSVSRALPGLPREILGGPCPAFRSGHLGLHVVCFPETASKCARFYWRICGEIVSSRLAQHALEGGDFTDGATPGGSSAPASPNSPDRTPGTCFCFPQGCVASRCYTARSVRSGPVSGACNSTFPMSMFSKVQEEIGAGVVFLGRGDDGDLEQLESLLHAGEVSGIYCEFPSNPLLRSVDLERVSRLRARRVFLSSSTTPSPL